MTKQNKELTKIIKVSKNTGFEIDSTIEKKSIWNDIIRNWYRIPKPIRGLILHLLKEYLGDPLISLLIDETSGWFNKKINNDK